MGYGQGMKAMSECEPNIEDRIVRLNKDIKIDNAVIKSLNKFMDHNGSHMVRDLRMNIGYSEIITNRRQKRKQLKELIKKQMADRPRLKKKKD